MIAQLHFLRKRAFLRLRYTVERLRRVHSRIVRIHSIRSVVVPAFMSISLDDRRPGVQPNEKGQSLRFSPRQLPAPDDAMKPSPLCLRGRRTLCDSKDRF